MIQHSHIIISLHTIEPPFLHTTRETHVVFYYTGQVGSEIDGSGPLLSSFAVANFPIYKLIG